MNKICDDHLKTLKGLLVDRGLWHLVPKDPDESFKRAESRITSGPTPWNFDPLMCSIEMMLENAEQEPFKKYLVEHPGNCLICVMNVPIWLNRAADGIKRYYDGNPELHKREA